MVKNHLLIEPVNTKIKKVMLPATPPPVVPSVAKPALINAKIAEIEKLWQGLNRQQIATWQRRNEKIESFIALVKDLAGDDEEKTEKIQRVLDDFEPFKNCICA